MEVNKIAEKTILDTFGQDAYPHRINMATLPLNSGLLKNVVSNVPGYYLEDRFFFVPGFPSMAQSMIIEALDKFYPKQKAKIRFSLKAFCSENNLVSTMLQIPSHIDMSSLPRMNGDKRDTIISIASYDEDEAKKYFNVFIDYLNCENIKFTLEDN